MVEIPIWPGSSSFATGSTPFGTFDTDTDFLITHFAFRKCFHAGHSASSLAAGRWRTKAAALLFFPALPPTRSPVHSAIALCA